MVETLRNLFRRRVRTSLTIIGLAIGVLALTVMGSMAEKMNLLVDSVMTYYGTRVQVRDARSASAMGATNPISLKYIDELRQVDGVKEALPTIYLTLEEDLSHVQFGMPSLIAGVHPKSWELEAFSLNVAKGRLLNADDRARVVVGADIAKQYRLNAGDRMKVRGRDFEVAGILERTLTVPDQLTIMNLPDAQELFLAALPAIFRPATTDIATEIDVFPEDLGDADALAERINQRISGIKALSPSQIKAEFEGAMVILNLVIMGSGIIALIVGGLSIINTMIMSVTERVREIGVKKAVGASTSDIMFEYMTEAGAMGFIGGLIGLVLGTILVTVINRITEDQGMTIFAVTPRLALGAILFAVILGLVAGIYPAVSAARRNPVEALRSE